MHACGVNQLCLGLWVGIEGIFHALDFLWEEHQEDVGWGVMLVD